MSTKISADSQQFKLLLHVVNGEVVAARDQNCNETQKCLPRAAFSQNLSFQLQKLFILQCFKVWLYTCQYLGRSCHAHGFPDVSHPHTHILVLMTEGTEGPPRPGGVI